MAIPNEDYRTTRRALRVKEAQVALGLGKTKIYQLIGEGRLASVRIDGTRLIPVEAIEELLAQHSS